MTIYDFANMLTGFVEAIMLFMLCSSFGKKREGFPMWISIVGTVVLTALINISNIVFNYTLINSLFMIISMFFVSFIYKMSVKNRALVAVLTFALLSLVEMVVLGILILAFGISAETAINDPEYRLIGIILSKALGLLIINIIRLKHKNKKILYAPQYWFFFVTMLITNISVLFLIIELYFCTEVKAIQIFSMIGSFMLLVSTFFALYLYEHLAEQAEIIYSGNNI